MKRTKGQTVYAAVSLAVMLAVLVMMFIFSGQNGEESADISGGFTRFIISVLKLDGVEGIFDKVHFFIRKLAHFTLYFVLGSSIYGIFSYFLKNYKVPAVILSALLIACTDEFHQLFSEGRTGKLADVILDTSGAACGCILSFLVVKMIVDLYTKSKKHM